MNNKILELISNVKNPRTQNTLLSDKFILNISEKDGAFMIEYKDDHFSLDEKELIENSIHSALASTYKPDTITVMAIDTNDKSEGESCGHSHAPKKAPNVFNKKRIPNVKKTLLISSGKGGVGKSTVAVNIAATFSEMGKKVGIIDADIYGPSIPMLLDRRDASPITSEDNKIIPIYADKIKFLSFGLFIDEKDPVVWRGPMLGGVLNQLMFDADWGELDYMIIDLPPGTGDVQLSLAQNLITDGAIVVSTPQDVAMLDSVKGFAMFEKVDVPVIGMIENMSSFICEHGTEYHIFGQGGVEKAAKELKSNFLGSIPIEIELRESSDKGEPFMSNKKNEGKKAWLSYMAICESLGKILDE